jgi:hypothetical protein
VGYARATSDLALVATVHDVRVRADLHAMGVGMVRALSAAITRLCMLCAARRLASHTSVVKLGAGVMGGRTAGADAQFDTRDHTQSSVRHRAGDTALLELFLRVRRALVW